MLFWKLYLNQNREKLKEWKWMHYKNTKVKLVWLVTDAKVKIIFRKKEWAPVDKKYNFPERWNNFNVRTYGYLKFIFKIYKVKLDRLQWKFGKFTIMVRNFNLSVLVINSWSRSKLSNTIGNMKNTSNTGDLMDI